MATRVLGPALAGMLSGGVRTDDGDEVTLEQLIGTNAGRLLLGRRLIDALQGLQPDDVMELADELLAGQVAVNGAPIDVPTPTPEGRAAAMEALDMMLPDVWAFVSCLKMALELNLRPIGAGGRSDASTAPPAS